MTTLAQATPLTAVHPAHAGVTTLLTRYADALDDGRVDDWVDFFADDGIYQITTQGRNKAGYPVGIVYCEGRGMLLDRVKALKIANIYESHGVLPYQWTAHHSARRRRAADRTLQFRRVPDRVRRPCRAFATGKYRDVMRRDGAGCALQERRAVMDSRRIDTLLVFPI